MHVPEHAGKERRIDAPPILQHEQFVRKNVVEPARADRPGLRIDASDLHSRHKTESVGNVLRPGSANVLFRNDRDGGGRAGKLLGFF